VDGVAPGFANFEPSGWCRIARSCRVAAEGGLPTSSATTPALCWSALIEPKGEPKMSFAIAAPTPLP